MKDILIGLIPVIASVLSCVVTALGFIAKVKSIIGDKDKTNKALKRQLEETSKVQAVLLSQLQTELSVIKDQLDEHVEQNRVLIEENQELKECVAKVTELVNTEKTIKTQLKVLLKEDK